jgi:PPM family protein phosphatase
MSRPENERGTAMSGRRLSIDAAGATARGRRRINADAFLIDEGAGFLAVSDAVGDDAHSAQMSRIALVLLREPFDDAWSRRPMAERFASEAAARLARGVAMANRRAYELRKSEPECRVATFAGIVVCSDHICIAHLGDSRIYLLRRTRDELAQVTEDHTVMTDLLSRGWYDDIAARMPDADALTRALGKRAVVEVQPSIAPWGPGDVALVCTDGVSDLVHAEAIQRVLTEATRAQQAAQRLVDAAEELGGWDNASAAVVLNKTAERAERGIAALGTGG